MKRMVFALVGVLACLGSDARADVVFDFDQAYTSDSATPAGSAPWLTAIFSDAGSGQVLLSLMAHLQAAQEFISAVGFNFTGPGNLAASAPNSGEFYTLNVPASNSLSGGGGASGNFSFGFSFPTSNAGGGAQRFRANDTITIVLSSDGGSIDPSMFLATNGAGQYGGVHIQGIQTGSGSGKFEPTFSPAPEPSTLLLAGSAIGLAGLRRLRRRPAEVRA